MASYWPGAVACSVQPVPSVQLNVRVAAHSSSLRCAATGIFGSFAFRLVREDGTAQEGMDNILNRLVEKDMPALTIYSVRCCAYATPRCELGRRVLGLLMFGLSVVLCLVALTLAGRSEQAYFWNISTLIPGIPVLAIMVRYNLMNSGVVGPKSAFFFGVVAPWLVTMFCYQASMLVSICASSNHDLPWSQKIPKFRCFKSLETDF